MRWRNAVGILIPAAVALAGLSGSYMVPLDHEAIQYAKAPVNDPVSRLQTRIDSGEAKLRYEPEFGYLRSVLNELNVPQSSQVLVFSKTSFQAPRIAPRTPRALYFNDTVSVGFVRTGEVLEFATLDPRQGTVFYTLDQERAAHPHFERRDVCLQCHQSGATLGIPGMLVRSVTPDRNGMPAMSLGAYITDHRSPLKERWGGWYVTGSTGDQDHMGNAVLQNPSEDDRLPVSEGTRNVKDLSRYFDTGAYLTPHSDVVALMTLEHQTQMSNLITRVGWEARMALYENGAINKSLGEPESTIRESTAHRVNAAVEDLLGYMLFSGEAKLTSPVEGTSGFAAEFQKHRPHDSKGRSLYDLDLRTRMFRYPCSFLIYSEAWDSMPPLVLDRVYQRLWQILTKADQDKRFEHISAKDGAAIIEILRATKPALAVNWGKETETSISK
jgi:hypothetical protein